MGGRHDGSERPASPEHTATLCGDAAILAAAAPRRLTTAPSLAAQARSGHLAAGPDEIHYFQKPMRRQFRFASERQSDSNRVLAERSPGCKQERCRSGSNAVVVIPASGSDDDHASRRRARDGCIAGAVRELVLLEVGVEVQRRCFQRQSISRG
jgi:hypothetical protein